MTQSALINWRHSPVLVRVVPFLIFVGLTTFQGQFGEASRYWVYLLKTIVGAALILSIRPWITEMRWAWSPEALLAGIGVFVIWVGLDGLYPSAESGLKMILCPVAKSLGFEAWCTAPPAPAKPWNPSSLFSPGVASGFVAMRILGSALVVPPLEEMFYRSFLYRYLADPDFGKIPLNCFRWTPFLVTAAIFGFSHYEWLPGILSAMIYQGVVLRKNRLGDAMTAHAITNALLGIWVAWKGAWHFW